MEPRPLPHGFIYKSTIHFMSYGSLSILSILSPGSRSHGQVSNKAEQSSHACPTKKKAVKPEQDLEVELLTSEIHKILLIQKTLEVTISW
jgi:hypothetical protein